MINSLDIIFLTLMSIALASGLLFFKFIAYDLNKESILNDIFITFDLFKDFIVIFILISYIVR